MKNMNASNLFENVMCDLFQDVLFALSVVFVVVFMVAYLFPIVIGRVGYNESELQNASRINAYDEYLERKANPQ